MPASPPLESLVVDETQLPPAVVLSADERGRLLELARAGVARAAGLGDPRRLGSAFERALEVARCANAFVTLTEHGRLRGCMGCLDPSRPVAESVLSAAVSATRGDPRFPPVAAAELPSIEIDVSVLGPLIPLADPDRFRLGIDGILIERGYHRGLLLPEVATLHGLDREGMLETVCLKAGLSPRAWREAGVHVSAFRTSCFGGPFEPR